jgi:hypothetical protein
MTEILLAITIWQPWASLIAAGAKPYEWRGWEVPKGMVGSRIAIHAGSRMVRRREISELLIDLRQDEAATSLVRDIALPLLMRWHTSPSMLPLSSVLCTAQLGPPVLARDYAEKCGIDSDRIDHSKWGWPLTAIEVLEPFVPASGHQGFWRWSRPDA